MPVFRLLYHLTSRRNDQAASRDRANIVIGRSSSRRQCDIRAGLRGEIRGEGGSDTPHRMARTETWLTLASLRSVVSASG